MTVQELKIIINDLAKDYYYIAPILYNMHFVASKKIPTIGVDRYGRGIYNPDFISSCEPNQIKGVLLHEVMHVVLKHIQRFVKFKNYNSFKELVKDKDPETQKDFRLFNVAADGFINDNILNTTNYDLPDGGVTMFQLAMRIGTTTEAIREMSTEEVFTLLKQSEKNNYSKSGNSGENQNKSSSSQQNKNNESGGENSAEQESGGSSLNDLEKEVEIAKVYSDKNIKNEGKIDEEIKEAIYKIDKAMDSDNKNSLCIDNNEAGTESAHEDARIKEALTSYNMNFKRLLYKFTEKVAGKNEKHKSWRRPSRKYRDIYPISQGRTRTKKKDFIFSIDVSGSMNEDKITAVVSIIKDYTAHNNLDTKYMFFSTYSSKIYNFTNIDEFKKNLSENFGGGTSYRAALNLDNNPNVSHNGMVIISDMDFSMDEEVKAINKVVNDNFLFIDITPNTEKEYNNCENPIINEYRNTEHYVILPN